jgi:hypothetical protein
LLMVGMGMVPFGGTIELPSSSGARLDILFGAASAGPYYPFSISVMMQSWLRELSLCSCCFYLGLEASPDGGERTGRPGELGDVLASLVAA